MSIPRYIRERFNTFVSAVNNGDIALAEGCDADGNTVYIACAVSRENGAFNFTPFMSVLADPNPYEAYMIGDECDRRFPYSIVDSPPNSEYDKVRPTVKRFRTKDEAVAWLDAHKDQPKVKRDDFHINGPSND